MLTALVVAFRSLALLCCGHRAVALENVALRQQVAVFRRTVKRPPLRDGDRLLWIVLSKAWRDWRTAVVVVQPDTVVRWHRQWLRRRWARRSRHARLGRPSVDAALRMLVDQMGVANPLWGAPRIHGELRKLGIDVSERTVSGLLRRRQRPPSQTWRTFLTNHLTSLVSLDFFTVPTLTGRVLFVLVLLSHHRRRIVHLRITEHPTAEWTAQQIIEAFPENTVPCWLPPLASGTVRTKSCGGSIVATRNASVAPGRAGMISPGTTCWYSCRMELALGWPPLSIRS